MSNRKLYTLTSTEFKVASHSTPAGQLVTIPANNIPMLRWPNGRWCWPANVYMIELYHRGLSRKDRGGTLLIYATQISNLIRFCYDNHVDFLEISDSFFSFFIRNLQVKKRQHDNTLAREANAVIAIGRCCLGFLDFISKNHYISNFIGENGVIKAWQREAHIKKSGSDGKILVRKFWHHRSFPTPDPKKIRHPISREIITKLQEAVLPASSSIFLRKRRYVMLRLLEITGARRSEVVGLTVESIMSASQMDYPMLKLETMKKGGNRKFIRYVPILAYDIEFLKEFIKVNRAIVVRKTCGTDHDDGFLLVSETTGRRLQPNTITQEISILRTQSQMSAQACAHQFRHRYITKLFVALIEQHKFENQDDFRRALLDTEQLKHQIREYTGHNSTASLDIYLHLAFDEITNIKKTIDIVSIRNLIDALSSRLKQYQLESKSGTIDSIEQITHLLSAAQADLQRLTS